MEDGAIGYFLTCVCVIISIYWVYRGFKVGVYSALNIFLVFFLALLVTLNYYELLMPVMQKVIPQINRSWRHSVSLIFTYCVVFGGSVYLCLWLCAERVSVHKAVDTVGGGLFGLATGISCCAALLFMWFSLPFAERILPLDDSTMFFPVHKITFHGITFVGKSMRGDRDFNGERFLRDLRYGLSDMRSVGEGFYITSIPTGLSVFMGGGGFGDLRGFYVDMKKHMSAPEDRRPSQQRKAYGRKGRTPLFIPGGGDDAVFAVMMDDLPSEVSESTSTALERFIPDGEDAVAETNISDRKLFMKIYRVTKSGNIGTLVALFQPEPENLRGMVTNFLPLRVCFPFNDAAAISLEDDLMKKGVPSDEARHIITQLRLGGKAVFLGLGSRLTAVEMTALDKWKIFEVEQPIDLDKPREEQGAGRVRRRPAPRPGPEGEPADDGNKIRRIREARSRVEKELAPKKTEN